MSDQSSIVQLIEDHWALGRIGGESFDARAGSLWDLLDLDSPRAGRLLLDPATGQPLNDDGE